MEKKIIKTLIIIFSFNISCFAQENTAIEIDGYKINYRSSGIETRKGNEPVIVFESGLGTDLGNWYKVFEPISKFAPVFSYDRPGIGDSEADEETPTTRNVVSKLHKMLQMLKIPPPYILVGHSLGGIYVRGFAVLYPEEVSGLVIIDPGDFTETREKRRIPYREVGLSEYKIDSIINKLQTRPLDPKMPSSIQEEHWAIREMRNKDFELENSVPLRDIPAFIMTSGKYENYPGGEALFRAKMKYRVLRWSELMNTIPRGRLTYTANAGHFIQIDDPELVISCVKIVYDEAFNQDK